MGWQRTRWCLSARSEWLRSGVALVESNCGAQQADLAQYFADKHATTLASTANRRLAVLRRFYRWAIREGRVAHDPTLRLKSATRPPRFPKSLSEEQVEALLRAPDTARTLGLRDRASWNFYMQPLSVSELVGLTLRSCRCRKPSASRRQIAISESSAGQKRAIVGAVPQNRAGCARQGWPRSCRHAACEFVTRQMFWLLINGTLRLPRSTRRCRARTWPAFATTAESWRRMRVVHCCSPADSSTRKFRRTSRAQD